MTPSGGAWLRAGIVGRPHGLDGSFHIADARPQLIELGGMLLVGELEARITRRAGSERRLIIRLEGHEDRAAAERLRGQELRVPRSAAPELEPDEWWAEDLEGCAVRDGDQAIGTVRRLLALPSCEVLEVERSSGGELLVPLIKDAVRSVDVAAREIDIDLEFLGEA